MNHRRLSLVVMPCAALASAALAAAPAQILTNHLGYEAFGPKRAVVQGHADDAITHCVVRSDPEGTLVLRGSASGPLQVQDWRDWRYWTFDLGALQQPGRYRIECDNPRGEGEQVLRSLPFQVQHNLLERATLSDVIAYFKAQRASGELDRADRALPFEDGGQPPIDVHGGWYDASGDYGIHLSQLDFTSYFNTQQVPLVVYSLGRSHELLEARGDANFNQIRRRLVDELSHGADFLVRMHRPGRSFYQTISAPGPAKAARDRRLGRAMTSFGLKKDANDGASAHHDGAYEVSWRSGGGFSVAGLALAARLGAGGEFDRATYLAHAESAFAFLDAHNHELTNDGVENIVDDYCALLAASELLRSTGKPRYATAAQRRALNLLDRLASDDRYRDYWRADGKDRPFFNPADAGAPVVALLRYREQAPAALRQRIDDAVRRSLAFELAITSEVANPFGLARQYVQSKGKGRRGEFFFPHDTETGQWWQGENARLASLAAAARLALPLFESDPAWQQRLAAYATDQLDWIIGKNPFDASMLHGSGRNNPGYGFFGSWQYTNFPGGIVNGITSGYADDRGIDFNLPHAQTGKDDDWRWGEQWLPHAAWYLLAVSARPVPVADAPKVVIGYLFTDGKAFDAAKLPVERLTHLNYAFANIVEGRMVEGFRNDARTFERLRALKRRNPALKLLVSVGGWTWSGAFSDMALDARSREAFIASAVQFVQRHRLDGIDIDWEYPGQPGAGNPHRPEDKHNYTALLSELRAALDAAAGADGHRYLLTIATGANEKWLELTEMAQVQAVVDYVNLMTYDQVGPWDPYTGHNAPLYTHPDNPRQLSAARVVDLYLAAGVPARKIVLGVPFYGHAWEQVPATADGLYQQGAKPTRRVNTGYAALARDSVDRDGYVRHWDAVSGVPFLYQPQQHVFVSYDDPQSLRLKGRYVLDRGLAGVMFWELSADTPTHDLLGAIWSTLRQ